MAERNLGLIQFLNFIALWDHEDDYEYNRWAYRSEKSERAKAREEQAKSKFTKMRNKFDRAVVQHKKFLINLGSKLESRSPLKMLPTVLIDEIFDYVAARPPVITEEQEDNNDNNNSRLRPRRYAGRRPHRRSDFIQRPFNAPNVVPLSIENMFGHGMKYYMRLLDPDCHLTSACWRDFGRFVRSHKGWNVKRVEATPNEKRIFAETRQGKVYFVYAFYTFPGGRKRRGVSKKHTATITKPLVSVVPANLYRTEQQQQQQGQMIAAAARRPGNSDAAAPPVTMNAEEQRIKRARLAAGYQAPDSNRPPKTFSPLLPHASVKQINTAAAGHYVPDSNLLTRTTSMPVHNAKQIQRARQAAGYYYVPDSNPLPPPAFIHSTVTAEQVNRARQAAGYVPPANSKPPAQMARPPSVNNVARTERARQAAAGCVPNSKHAVMMPPSAKVHNSVTTDQIDKARQAAGYVLPPDGSKPPKAIVPSPAAINVAATAQQIKRARQAAGYVHPNDSKPRSSLKKSKIPPAAVINAPMSDKIKRARQAAGYVLPPDSPTKKQEIRK